MAFMTQSRSCPSFGSREIVPHAHALGRHVAGQIAGPDPPFPLVACIVGRRGHMNQLDRDRLMRMAALDCVRRLSEIYPRLTATKMNPGFVSANKCIPPVNTPRAGSQSSTWLKLPTARGEMRHFNL
jgi:hypothetical protein